MKKHLFGLILKLLEESYHLLPDRSLARFQKFLHLTLLSCSDEERKRVAQRSGPALRGLTPNQSSLERYIRDPSSPWISAVVPRILVPGMISEEEAKYYKYLCGLYSGRGELIELGPWLGCSTAHIISALISNPTFKGHKLHVFDDFVWRPEWMDQYVSPEERFRRHESFQPPFEKYAEPILQYLLTTRCKIVDFDGNESLPSLQWSAGPIEILIVDCGRTIEVNEAWLKVFEPNLIPGVSLVVLQDFGTHRDWPHQWFNQLKLFVGKHATKLDLVHELRGGGIATFIYRNK